MYLLNVLRKIRQRLVEPFKIVMQNRQLTLEMAKREIYDRYLGQVLGGFWSVAHPLILILVYIYVFGFVFKMKIGGTVQMPLDYITYLLAGLIPWLFLVDAMGKSSTVIIGHANLVKQVVFPIEILPVKSVLASLFTMGVSFVILLIYVFIKYHYLLWTYIFLAPAVILATLGMIGVSYILSSVGVYFRDVKDFVQVLVVAGVYLIPVIYLPEAVPDVFRPFLYANPFSYIIWVFQDILYYGRLEHLWAWPVYIVLCLGVYYLGYYMFRKLKIMFGSAL